MENVMERYKRLPLGNICDANGKRGSMDQGIRPLDPALHMAGRAYTVRCHPGDNLAIHKAIREAPDGSVLVIDAGGYTGGGHIGEIMCFACMQRGIRGLVIDGTCRDADDICALKFPVFSRGLCPNGTVKETVGQTEIPILCGGVQVRPATWWSADGTASWWWPRKRSKLSWSGRRPSPRRRSVSWRS